MKILRGDTDELCSADKIACKSLVFHSNPTFENESNEAGGVPTIDYIVSRQKRRRLNDTIQYIDCGFRLGSVAEIERT